MGPPAFSTKVLIFMKVETTLPLEKEARILQFIGTYEVQFVG